MDLLSLLVICGIWVRGLVAIFLCIRANVIGENEFLKLIRIHVFEHVSFCQHTTYAAHAAMEILM